MLGLARQVAGTEKGPVRAMAEGLIIEGRRLGRKRAALFDDFSIPFPPDVGDGGITLRKLISRIVAAEVEAFNVRQESRRLVRVLSPQKIEDGLAGGKVDAGGHEARHKPAQVADAIAAALQAFEDGLYLVVIDGVEQRDLDAQVFVQPGSRITFIRLVFLAGA